MLQFAQIVDDIKTASDEVSVGKTVTFKELPDEEPEEYQIVGAAEADPLAGKVSNDSPIARGLLGHKVGEKIDIEIPDGTMHVEILGVD